EARRDLHLAREPPVRAAATARERLLERDAAAELHVECLDDAPHAAAPELRAEPVAIRDLARPRRWLHRRRRLSGHRVVEMLAALARGIARLRAVGHSVQIPVDVRNALVVADVDGARALLVGAALV